MTRAPVTKERLVPQWPRDALVAVLRFYCSLYLSRQGLVPANDEWSQLELFERNPAQLQALAFLYMHAVWSKESLRDCINKPMRKRRASGGGGDDQPAASAAARVYSHSLQTLPPQTLESEFISLQNIKAPHEEARLTQECFNNIETAGNYCKLTKASALAKKNRASFLFRAFKLVASTNRVVADLASAMRDVSSDEYTKRVRDPGRLRTSTGHKRSNIDDDDDDAAADDDIADYEQPAPVQNDPVDYAREELRRRPTRTGRGRGVRARSYSPPAPPPEPTNDPFQMAELRLMSRATPAPAARSGMDVDPDGYSEAMRKIRDQEAAICRRMSFFLVMATVQMAHHSHQNRTIVWPLKLVLGTMRCTASAHKHRLTWKPTPSRSNANVEMFVPAFTALRTEARRHKTLPLWQCPQMADQASDSRVYTNRCTESAVRSIIMLEMGSFVAIKPLLENIDTWGAHTINVDLFRESFEHAIPMVQPGQRRAVHGRPVDVMFLDRADRGISHDYVRAHRTAHEQLSTNLDAGSPYDFRNALWMSRALPRVPRPSTQPKPGNTVAAVMQTTMSTPTTTTLPGAQ